MDTAFLCIDCRAAHTDPAEATLGHRVRCLDCQLEIDLSFELANLPRPQLAA